MCDCEKGIRCEEAVHLADERARWQQEWFVSKQAGDADRQCRAALEYRHFDDAFQMHVAEARMKAKERVST